MPAAREATCATAGERWALQKAGIASVSDPGYNYKLHFADHGRGGGVGRGLGVGVASRAPASGSSTLATAIDVKHDVHVQAGIMPSVGVGSGNPQGTELR